MKTRFVWKVSEAEERIHAVLPFPDVADAIARMIRGHRAGDFAIWKSAEGRSTFFFEGRWFRRRNDVAFEIESEDLPPDVGERRIIAPAPAFEILFGRRVWTEIVLADCGKS